MKGIAIDVTTAMTLALIVLIALFLFLGVFKDIIFKQRGLFGLVPGSDTAAVTDQNLDDEASIICNKVGGSYSYKISLNRVGFDYAKQVNVFPVFFFKNVLSSSNPASVNLPGRISFNSLEMRSTEGPKAGKESVIIAFMKKNEKCQDLAKASTSFETFVNMCAKSLETETSIMLRFSGC